MEITLAVTADIPQLCELLDVLFTQESEFEPDRQAQMRGLAMVIDGENVGDILVARQAGELIGMVNLLYTVSTALGERVALLEDMVVTPSGRGLGVGTQLLERACELAKANGAKRITLLTDGDNDGGQRFYQRNGFSCSTMMPFRKVLK